MCKKRIKIEPSTEEKILELKQQGFNGKQIGEQMGLSKSVVYKYLRLNRIPDFEEKTPKKIKNINELISLRLLYFCEDIAIIAKRLASEIILQKPEKIVISKRTQSVIKKEKIQKVINILEASSLSLNLEYAAGG